MKARDLLGDLFAGTVIATSNIALAVSFAAAIFQGELAAGFTTGVWIMLLTMIAVGLAIGMFTTLPPIAGGPDTAVIAVIGLMAPAIAGPMLAAGIPMAAVLVHVMLGMTLVALASSLMLLVIGLTALGQSLRFVPFPLVAGFLAVTGILLIFFSVQIVTGEAFALTSIGTLWADEYVYQLAIMFGFSVLLAAARSAIKSPLVTPLVFFWAALALNMFLQTGRLGDLADWYLWAAKGLTSWAPYLEVQATAIDWTVYLSARPELATCVIVGLISLIVGFLPLNPAGWRLQTSTTNCASTADRPSSPALWAA